MRIALFSEVFWPMVSGVSTTLARTADALRRRGHLVRVYTATYDHEGAERPDVHCSPSRPFLLSPEVQWASPNGAVLEDDLRVFGPDVVHLATEWAMGFAGLRAARALGLPIVASAHTDYERYATRYRARWAVAPGWLYLRWFYRQARRVLAPSRFYERHLRDRGVANTGVWSRGVDLTQFGPGHRSAEYRSRLGIGVSDPIVACVGRIAKEKGIDRLLEAWPRVAAAHPTAHLVFTGDGTMAPEIAGRALPRVHLTGMKRGTALATAYASADVFVMPSTTETFGNVTLEAMASGVATVAMAEGGILDFGVHAENVWMASPGEPDELAIGIDRLLSDERLRKRLADGGIATAAGRDWEPIFDGLVAEYQRAVGTGAAQAA